MNPQTIAAQVGAQEIVFQTGKLAKLADGAVTVQCGDTMVIVTAVSQTKIREGQDFFPLSVEYKEKAAAAGRFPGGYFKREGRPTEKEILTCRMTDRPLRPLFPKGYLYDTQIISTLLSADGENDSDILTMNGASAALCVSDIPFAGPIGAVRVGRVDGQFVVNPTHTQRIDSDLDLVYVGSKNEVIMIEGAADQLDDEEFIKALEFAQAQVQVLVAAQEKLADQAGKPKREVPLVTVQEDLLEVAYDVIGDRIEHALSLSSKVDRGAAVKVLRDEVTEAIEQRYPEATSYAINQAFEYVQTKATRRRLLDEGKRADGRSANDLRTLSGEVGLLPRAHGSALFARGETQALALTTLAPTDEEQRFDNYTGGEDSKSFILHYNFPPFSVGETGRVGGINRREIGHGALAERSIEPVIPSTEDFPYAIRVTSEVMESNGSTSMATVCSGVMSLFNAGVPLIKPVAGISVGLMTDRADDGSIGRYEMLLDILGLEDFFGDMDFKLCGTDTGVTGFQLDLKLPGIPVALLAEAVRIARSGRMKVLDYMGSIIDKPAAMSPYAPRIEVVKIKADRIGELIGPGGKVIKGIQAETGAEINIEDDGTVFVYATKKASIDRALEIINGIFAEIEVGRTYTGRVVNVTNFGAFMQVLPGQDGLIHISELSDSRVNRVEDVVNVGDMVSAKCVGVDDRGRVKLSRRAAMEEADQKASEGGSAD